jgi:hypothetical protein
MPSGGTTWEILERDGANREVPPYLSSLGQGESGTGVVTSPPFVIASDTISFTIRGHDGQGGGGGKNYIALVDARKGKTLLRTAPPANDALQENVWDVSSMRGQEVRIEVHDGDDRTAYAWLGIGQIDAGPAMRIDFRQGMPEGWQRPQPPGTTRYDTLTGGVSFKRSAAAFGIIPRTGHVELPCGFEAKHLFFLGCTVNNGRPTETYGGIELHYAGGTADVFPLIYGFSLDGRYKLPSRAASMHLRSTADPYQLYLVIKPRKLVIEKIRLVADPERGPVPRITAITCETAADNEHLMSLPDRAPSADEAAWIETHAVSAESLDLNEVMRAVREAYNLPRDTGASGTRFRKLQRDSAF